MFNSLRTWNKHMSGEWFALNKLYARISHWEYEDMLNKIHS